LFYWIFLGARTPEFVQEKKAFRQTSSHQKRRRTRRYGLGPQIQLPPAGVHHTE